jgi:hypothetical protein
MEMEAEARDQAEGTTNEGSSRLHVQLGSGSRSRWLCYARQAGLLRERSGSSSGGGS